jgi:hypothetical protein
MVDAQIAATVMLGIVSKACGKIRESVGMSLLESDDRYLISRSDLILLEAISHAGNATCGVLMANAMTDMRDALVTVSGSSENGWIFRCVACQKIGGQQDFNHSERCPAAVWDRYVGHA